MEASSIGVDRTHSKTSLKRWTTAWKSQETSAREKFRDGCREAKNRKNGSSKHLKPSELEDIREWSLDEMLEHMRRLGNVCVVTGIRLGDIQLHCDRMWDDGKYNSEETAPMWDRINYAKVALPAFKTKAEFEAYCEVQNITGHPIRKLVEILRTPLKRVRQNQIRCGL